MSAKFAWKAILQYKLVVVACIVAGLAGALLYGVAKPAHYEATAQIMVEMPPDSGDTDKDPAADNRYLRAQLPTYLEYAQSRRVLKPVADKLHLSASADTLRRRLDFSVPSDTLIVKITATWTSAQGAADLANAAASSFTSRVPGFATDSKDKNRVEATVFAPATAPTTSANVAGRFGIGGLAGLLAGVLLAWVLKLRDPFTRSLGDIAAAGAVPILGAIPRQRGRTRSRSPMRQLLAEDAAVGLPTEFDGLYARTGLADSARRPRVVTVVAATSGAASGAIAWGLARAAAGSGLRTILTTGDPSMHRTFSARVSTLDASDGPELLPVNTIAPPSEGIISTAALEVALADARPMADVVLIAAGSPIVDPNVASYIDVAEGVIVTAPPRAPHRVVHAVCAHVGQSDGRLLGSVVTDRAGDTPDEQEAPAQQSRLAAVGR